MTSCYSVDVYFFFNDTATTEIYTLSLHDALPIFRVVAPAGGDDAVGPHRLGVLRPDLRVWVGQRQDQGALGHLLDRKSTRLNSSHANISYAVFCLKKKQQTGLDLLSDQCHESANR